MIMVRYKIYIIFLLFGFACVDQQLIISVYASFVIAVFCQINRKFKQEQ